MDLGNLLAPPLFAQRGRLLKRHDRHVEDDL